MCFSLLPQQHGQHNSIKSIPKQTHSQTVSKSLSHFSNKRYLCYYFTVCLFFFSPPVFLPFSLCVYMFEPGSSLLIWTHNPSGQWGSLCKLNCVNFASTLKLAMRVLRAAWSTQHRWLSKEEVNGTGKQEVPVRWLTACLDTKRWILREHWLTDKSTLTNRILNIDAAGHKAFFLVYLLTYKYIQISYFYSLWILHWNISYNFFSDIYPFILFYILQL